MREKEMHVIYLNINVNYKWYFVFASFKVYDLMRRVLSSFFHWLVYRLVSPFYSVKRFVDHCCIPSLLLCVSMLGAYGASLLLCVSMLEPIHDSIVLQNVYCLCNVSIKQTHITWSCLNCNLLTVRKCFSQVNTTRILYFGVTDNRPDNFSN